MMTVSSTAFSRVYRIATFALLFGIALVLQLRLSCCFAVGDVTYIILAASAFFLEPLEVVPFSIAAGVALRFSPGVSLEIVGIVLLPVFLSFARRFFTNHPIFVSFGFAFVSLALLYAASGIWQNTSVTDMAALLVVDSVGVAAVVSLVQLFYEIEVYS